jgi:hypothetical protein
MGKKMRTEATAKNYEWMLVQRLHSEIGAVSVHRARYLDAHYGPWATKVTDADVRLAMDTDHPELSDALVRWYNRGREADAQLTLAQIRVARVARPRKPWATR